MISLSYDNPVSFAIKNRWQQEAFSLPVAGDGSLIGWPFDGAVSTFAATEGLHERLRYARAPGHYCKGYDGQNVGHHQKSLVGHDAAQHRLQAKLKTVKKRKKQGTQQGA